MSALGKIDPRYRVILGLAGLGSVTDTILEKTATELCPGRAVEEAVTCLLDSLSQINCPEGFRKQFLEVFCLLPLEIQKGLIDRAMRPIEMTHVTRISLIAASSWAITDETVVMGQGTSTFDKGKLPEAQNDVFVLCGIQMLYGRGASATSAIYGRIATQNEVAAANAVNYSHLEMPGEIATGEIFLEIANKKIWQKEPASRFRNYSVDRNLLGYSALTCQHVIKAGDQIRMKLTAGSSFTPPSTGGASWLETSFHGVGIMPV